MRPAKAVRAGLVAHYFEQIRTFVRNDSLRYRRILAPGHDLWRASGQLGSWIRPPNDLIFIGSQVVSGQVLGWASKDGRSARTLNGDRACRRGSYPGDKGVSCAMWPD